MKPARSGASFSAEERPPIVPAWAAGLASLLVPGLGQVLARTVWGGVLIFCSMLSIAGMMVWRISLLGHLQATPAAMVQKAIELQPLFVPLVAVCFAASWLWNVRDAVRRVRQGRGSPALFVILLFTFFALGWQISEIVPSRLDHRLPAGHAAAGPDDLAVAGRHGP